MFLSKSFDFSRENSLEISSIFKTSRYEQPEVEIIPKPIFANDHDLTQQAKDYSSLEKQVIVHCFFKHGTHFDPRIRIWPSTFLKPKGLSEVSKLITAINISFYPDWTWVKPYSRHDFTLIFEGLPKDCILFDLEEDIPEPGGFFLSNIQRNESDVYHIEV